MSVEKDCMVCGKTSRFMCSSCHRVHYCSKDHQRQDWKQHKSNCISYKVVTSKELGRHLIATRCISEGEVIIRESPLIVGPAQVTSPVCLGCYKLLQKSNKKECSKCGWPMCCKNCQKSEAHVPECEITIQRKCGKVKIQTFAEDLPHPSYECLTVLRCLHLKNSKPHVWNKLIGLQSHCEERKTSQKYSSDQRFIANFIREFFNYTEFSSEEILRVAGIVQINSHEVPLRKPGYVAIYEKASFLEHSCWANCLKSFTNSGDLVIRAAGNIAPGDHLSICYTDPLWGKRIRLCHLMETKFFFCRCPRCSDPTELGTHFNSVKCSKNCGGYTIQVVENDKRSLTDNALKLNDSAVWVCQKCNAVSSEENNLMMEVAIAVFKLDKTNAEDCKTFLKKYENILHPNHHVLLRIKLALIDLIAWQDKLNLIDDKDIQWVTETCMEIYTLARTLIPAENRLTGVVLYQLHLALMESNRRKYKQLLDVNQTEIRQNLLECQDVLMKAHKYLSYEPDELPEGKMAKEAMRALSHLEKLLQ